mmetsp:Transcript_5640/g.11072  ORF Transcript_5640/g.11072 Transcript_5640/m.11072 type:complete len:392 (-) Transcript_5640:1401-2576(-)
MQRHLAVGAVLWGILLGAASGQLERYAVAGSALLLPWYLGAMEALVEEGVVQPESMPGAGLSGGAVTAMLTCAGVRPVDQYQLLKGALVDCYESWDPKSGVFPCNGQLSSIEYKGFSTLYDPSSINSIAEKCSHVGIAFTEVDPNDPTMNTLTSTIVANHSTDEAILRDLISSSFLSCSSMSVPYFVNDGMATVDGGYSTTLSDLCGGNETSCLTIQVYYPNTTEAGPVCTTQDNVDAAIAGELVSQCLEVAGGTFNQSAKGPPPPAWANFTSIGDLPTSCPAGPSTFMPPGEADIYPGKYIPLNYSCFEWQCMAYIPYPDRLDDLFNLGQEEARAWVKANAGIHGFLKNASSNSADGSDDTRNEVTSWAHGQTWCGFGATLLSLAILINI